MQAGRIIRRVRLPAPASGLALSPDGSRLYVTCAAPKSTVVFLDTATCRPAASVAAGHTAMAPVVSPNGATLYVCNRFDNDVSVLDTTTARELGRIRVPREPDGAAITPDGKRLLVINALPTGRADVPPRAAEVSLVDIAARRVDASVALPNGSTALRGIAISPDGRLAAVTHLLSRYYLPTTQLERGWVQTNAVSILDVARGRLLGTVLLDEIDQAAANPWALGWTGQFLCVTHAGTHEVSVIDITSLLRKLDEAAEDPADNLSFLLGLRKRVKLEGKGPRALAIAAGRVWVGSYFSDTIESIDLAEPALPARLAAKLSRAAPGTVRKGEALFNDGSLSFQGWLSCASCHSPDARVDALNWDLLNDGIGNPKNVRSLLLAHRTPPAMTQGVRDNAEMAVRAGIRHLLFAQRPEEEAAAIDQFLKSLKPLPSPLLVNGKLSPAAQRGRKEFFDATVGCAACHKPPLFTNLKSYDVGTRAPSDNASVFDTPTLVECWRTAPYLHDGSAATMRDVLTSSNRQDKHGKTSHLTPAQIDDLAAYLLSL